MRKKALVGFLLCLCLLLPACSAQSSEDAIEEQQFDNSYTLKRSDLPYEMAMSVSQYSDENSVYLCGLDSKDGPIVGKYTEDGFREYELPNGISYAFACCIAEQELSLVAGDQPENRINSRGEYVNNRQDEYALYILNYDADGVLKSQIPLEIKSGMSVQSVRYLDGCYYIMSVTELVQIDREGRLLNTMALEDGSFLSQTIMDGQLVLCQSDSVLGGGSRILVLESPESFSFNVLWEDDSIRAYGLGVSEGGELLLNGDDTICLLGLASGESSVFFDFYAAGELMTDYSDIYFCDGSYLLSGQRQDKILRLVPRTGNEKTELLLWAYFSDRNLTALVSGFNQSSDSYSIRVETAQDLGEEQINARLAANQGPDLFFGGQGSFPGLQDNGIYDDLSPYIDKSKTLGWDDILQPLLAATCSGDELYSIPLSFTVYTIFCRTDLLPEPGTDLKALAAMEQVQDGSITLFPSYYSGRDTFSWLSQMYLARYMDKERAACNFDTELFRQILEYCAGLPDTGSNSDSPFVFSGEQIPGTLRLLFFQKRYGENFTLNTDFGSAFVVEMALSISSASQHKDGAWEFIEYAYSTDLDNERFSLPASVERLGALLTSGVWDDETHDYQYLNESTLEIFWELVENTSCTRGDDELLSIIKQEAEKYFAGDKSLDDTVEVINSRASIYMAEQYG